MVKANFKTNALRILETNNIDYVMHTYECKDFLDGTEIARITGMPQNMVFKTIVCVGASKQHFVFVVPVAKELDLKACARVVGEKSIELIKLSDITKITGYIRGGCSPVGMKKPFKTVIDSSCLELSTMLVSAGKPGYQMELNPSDLIKLTNSDTESITL